MGETTAISWCDHTFNPWIGCTKVSPACDGCYAEAMMDKRYGRVEWGAPGKGVGTRERTSAGNWSKPKAWNRKAAEAGTRPFVFCASLADVFDNQVPTAWRADLFELIYATPHLVWLLLTKRPQNIVRQFGAAFDRAWPRNAAIGTTVEDQDRANLNLPHLLLAKAELKPAFAFLSCEPLLGPIDLGFGVHHHPDNVDGPELRSLVRAAREHLAREAGTATPDWVITGGETDQGGHKARPTHLSWVRSIRDQCAAAGVAYHHKQNGEWTETVQPGNVGPTHWIFPSGETREIVNAETWPAHGTPIGKIGKARTGRLLDGIEHNTRPEVAA